jgi:hypothetical protein
MSDDEENRDMVSLASQKIFPRNLTARASYLVPGNPVNSRPEAGVDNCYPGLEFDQRNLDQRFFPGLVFYFHRADGARLIDGPLLDAQTKAGISFGDLNAAPYYIWGILGRFLVEYKDPSMLGCQAQSGMEVWRRVHDLLPGPVAVALGPSPGINRSLDQDIQDALNAAYAAVSTGTNGRYAVLKNPDGTVKCIVMGEMRARYLDDNGVIDPEVYTPGDITKTMCAPWMYDFRDCYCFYWSSNKPDIVSVPMADGSAKDYVNFLRRTEDRTSNPPFDVDYYKKSVDGKTLLRRDTELRYEDMVDGWWQKLPVVLGDLESEDSIAEPVPAPMDSLKELQFADVVRELTYLATVEHALTVEYLYAYYSMNQSVAQADLARRVQAAAKQVFAIAVDEMRHLMWANLALYELGAKASVGRAKTIGEAPNPARNGRKMLSGVTIKYLNTRFSLNPLDAKTLDWFIRVEAPSKKVNQGLDGMYVYILERLRLGQDIPNAERLVPLIKLIIDEGHGHWERFTRIKETLDGIPEQTYLHPINNDAPSATDAKYLALCDSYYQLILKAIEVSVTLGREAQSELVGAAVRIMQNLDELALVLASRGYLPRFTLPRDGKRAVPKSAPKFAVTATGSPSVAANADALSQLEYLYGKIDSTLTHVSQSDSAEERLRANEQKRRLAAHRSEVDRILMSNLSERGE